MDEDIGRAVFAAQKTVSLCVVKPLYCAFDLCHARLVLHHQSVAHTRVARG